MTSPKKKTNTRNTGYQMWIPFLILEESQLILEESQATSSGKNAIRNNLKGLCQEI